MSTKGYGSITLTDVLDGAQIWTTTTAPTSPNYTFTISNLSGDSDATIREGDLIFYSYYRYTVADVGSTTVVATNQQSLRGANGVAGLNTATVYLYQRSNDQPGQPNFESTYTFSTKTLSGIPSGNKWSQTIDTGTNPVYMTFATASSTTDSDTIPASEWSNAVKLTGEDGVSGYNQATIFLYRRASSASKPTAKPTYTFATGALSAIPSGWSRTIPEDNGYPCWVTTTTAISRDASVAVGAWSDVQKLAEDGFTPTVTATRSGNTTTITITNSTGTSTTDIEDGERGATWYAGTAITGRSGTETAFPNSGVANAIIGDHYLNTSTQNVYVCTTPGTPSVAKWVYEQNIKGETGATGDKGYIHIKYSNDGGTTFTGNGGEDPGDWMGVYSDNTQADSTSVSAYQWVKIRGLSVEKIEKEYCLVNSDTAVPSGTTWSSTMPDYESGKWYWSREVTTWSDGSTTNGEAILEVATTEALHRASLGLGMKINYSSFSNTDPGEVYLHGYTNGEPADVNGFVYWKDVKRTVNKGMINPNTIVPYNRYIYIVLRLTNATATTGALRIVWYNSGWKYAIPPTPTKVEGGWEWIENRDVVLGQFIEPGPESDVVEAYLYNPPRSASQVVTTNASPYQYSQAAVEWNASYGGRVKNATDMLAEWAAGDFATTTEIDGGHIATNTIEAKHFVGDHIVSSNWEVAAQESSPFSADGTRIDLLTGNMYMKNLGVNNTNGELFLNGDIYFMSGYIGNSGASNYWKVGTKTDANQQQKAFLDGVGNVYIQTGEFMLSNGLLDTRHYNASNQITYPVYDNTYWDFGIQSPILDSSTSGYVSGIDDNFIYIRKHANTIPSLKTDWDYVFRVDKNGMVWINGESLDQKYAAIGSGSAYVVKEGDSTINGSLTVTGSINGTATQATQLTHWISINGTQWNGSSNTTIGTLGVGYGGTGATSFTSGAALIGNGSGAIQTRSITNNTTVTYITGSTNLITANTLKFFNGAYDSSHNSNLEYVKLGKLGTVVTHDYDDFITVDGGIIDGSLQVTELTAGDLIVTGAARFTNGLIGDLTGNAATATKVNKDLIIKLASGTTEGTNMFTFNGSAAKTVDITKSAIGLGNVENTKLSTWAGSSNLTTAKVGTLAGAAVKAVDTSISAGSTSVNLPTSAAVASFVEGKGYVTSSGVTSVRVQATSPVVSSVNTAQSSSLNTTISLADAYGDTKNPYGTKTANYVLAGPSSGNAAAPTFRALVAADIPSLTKSKISDFPTTWALANITDAADLQAIEALSGTNGFLKKTAANTWMLDTSNYVTSSGVTSITLKAGTGISLDTDNTAITSTGTRTITNAGVRSISESTANGKISVNTNGTSTDVAIHGLGSWAYKSSGSASDVGLGNVTNNKQVKGLSTGTTSGHFVSWGSDGYTVADSGYAAGQVVKSIASNNDGKLVLTYLDNTTSDPIEVKIIGSSGSSVSYADALNVNGTAVGSATQPVYIDSTGKPQTANSIPKLNNGTTGGTFYAPTGAGTSGQVLKSSGTGAPTWVDQSTLSVGSATKATNDSDNNAINTTYLKKSGGTMTGKLTLLGGQYSDSFTSAALDLQNSNIVGVNSIYTADASDNSQEGIHFYRDATHVDTLYSQSGVLYYVPYRKIGETGTSYKVICDNSEFYEAYLKWGGRNYSGSYGPIDAAMVPELGANRLELINAAGIEIEYSRDGGQTWTDYGASDAAKKKFFSSIGNTLYIGKADSQNFATADFQLRATITTNLAGVYTTLNKFVIYITSNGSSGTWVSIDRAIKSAETTWINVVNKVGISGWSGYNVINTPGITTYGNTSSQNSKLRFTFGCTSHTNTTYVGLGIHKILGFGGMGHIEPNNIAKYGRIYTYDENLNTSFPAQVTATQFNGALSGTATSSYYPRITNGNEIRFLSSSKPSTATDLYIGYKWSDGTSDAKINNYRFCNGNTGLATVTASTFYGALSGNATTATSATSATKATNDSDGNAINTTYLKKSGGTMTGGITFPNDPSAYNTKGIIFAGGSKIGENTSNKLGIYSGSDLYLRPDSGSEPSTNGLILSGATVYPSGNNTHSLGTSSNKWNNVYSTTFTGALSGNASTATKWASAQTVYVTLGTASTTTTLQGGSSSAQTIGVNGTLGVGNGGTGQTSAINAANAFLNALTTGSSVPTDNDYYISQYVGGGTTTTTYHRRPVSALWSYISTKTEAIYAKLSGATFTGAVTGTSFGASSYMSVNTGNSGTAGGLALYGTTPTSYGIAMRQTSNCGKHGYVQGDWATAFYMSASANVTNRGWIFRSANTTAHNVASISGEGHAAFNGSVTVGANEANTSGCRMEFNSTTASLDFVFN